jgi:hypothetical protein
VGRHCVAGHKKCCGTYAQLNSGRGVSSLFSNISFKRTPTRYAGRRRLTRALGGQEHLRFKCCGCGGVPFLLRTSAAGQPARLRGAIGFRSVQLVGRGSASGKFRAPRGEIGFRSIQLTRAQIGLQQAGAGPCAVCFCSGLAPVRLRLPKRSASCTVCLTNRSSGRRSIACALTNSAAGAA